MATLPGQQRFAVRGFTALSNGGEGIAGSGVFVNGAWVSLVLVTGRIVANPPG